MSKQVSVLVPVADGSEDIETVALVDTLRRAGCEVVLASVSGVLLVTLSRKIKIEADALIEDVKDKVFDGIFLPGGMPGAEHLRDSAILKELLIKQAHSNRLFGAVCASPGVVLAAHGLLTDKFSTAYPSHCSKLPLQEKIEDRVVVSGNCVTSRGPGTTIEWALKIVELLFDTELAKNIGDSMLVSQ
eukprot:TRINITY_DN1592_c0_g1_i2.p2 TRINITY_DN1592_c0_g1~~TRINITY_DN1592_c0_g1_i2.p2  ORF type:complete len:188 (-),score=44.62 TRINITY_DN1592_c0_g1_i2:25-588(-)